MNLPRFYCSPINTGSVTLSPDQAHHLAHVLRLSPGALVELFDGLGTLAPARLTALRPHVTLQVDQLQTASPPANGRIIIAASLAKADRFDWLIAKCTELGADHIAPTIFQRTIKLSRNPRTFERWNKLILSAARQCRRLFLPSINPPTPLDQTLESLKNDYPQAQLLLGSLNPDTPSLIEQKFSDTDVIAFVGPEGGLTDDEESLLKNQGALPTRLTDTTLRIETAAVTFTAVLACQRHPQQFSSG